MLTNYDLLFCLIGLGLFYACDSGSLKERTARVAYVVFAFGLLAWLLAFGHRAFSAGL